MRFVLTAALLGLTFFGVHAENSVVAKVNGEVISQNLLDEAIKQRINSGTPDSAELRAMTKDELISRQLLIQESRRLKLDQTPEVQVQKRIMEQNLLIELIFADDLAKTPITDSDLKNEYERQAKEAKDNDLQEYKLRDISTSSESEARAVIARLKKGEDFKKLISEKSKQPNSGEVDWTLSQQIVPAIRGVIVNLAKGSYTLEPVRSGNSWHVVMLVDKRSFKVPVFDDVKNQIRVGLIQKRRNELITRLKKQAQIDA